MFQDPYHDAREAMVRDQLERRGVRDPRVLDAMRAIPRHLFLPESERQHAYEDRPWPIGLNQTISQPYMVGMMTQLLNLKPSDHVLEIGTGSGYQAAILSKLAASVDTIERLKPLVDEAAGRLARLGCANIRVLHGDGTLGFPEGAPFDAIIVTAGAPAMPPCLKAQLAPGGRCICPVGSRHTQELIRLTRKEDGFFEEQFIPCVFVPLIGDQGWDI